MTRTVRRLERLNEQYVEAVHESGLKILLCPKPDFTGSYALFGTRYGSIDTKFRLKGEDRFVTIPEGTAHFLEHKLFESEEGDAFDRFSKTGASANAYTSFDRTCYLFSCSDRFDENLDILLDFVRHPYFTEQTVQKEQGIIGQEIRMYEDDPGWCVMFNLLGALYRNHPVRIDIAGTAESIAQINADTLYRCYRTFYHPSNMFLCVCGPVDPDKILEKVDRLLAGAQPKPIERGTHDEPRGIVTASVRREMAVAIPQFCFGYKEDCTAAPEKTLRERVETDILLEMIAGRSGRLYNELLEQGLINDSFDASYFTGYGYAAELFEGESRDPERVADAIRGEISRMRSEGLDPAEFTRAKNSLYGRNVMMYNSVERVATALASAAMEGYTLFDIDGIYESVTVADLQKRLEEQMDPAYCALSVVCPADGGASADTNAGM